MLAIDHKLQGHMPHLKSALTLATAGGMMSAMSVLPATTWKNPGTVC